MSEGKKISFGFSKLVKPKISISTNHNLKSDDSVQFIDFVEDQSIKVKNEVPKKDDVLVIPLPKQDAVSGKRKELLQRILNSSNTIDDTNDEDNVLPSDVSIQSENVNCKNETLDEKAVRELIEDSKKVSEPVDASNFTVPLLTDETKSGKVSTLDDYDSIPVEKFGIAMLRGMGWAPGKGIGKNEQVVSAKQPLLRPKGLGLGADKVIKPTETSKVTSEPLKLIKGSFVRIIAGVHKDTFGEIIGFDDETGRSIVKMALGGNVLTFNEFMVEVISKEDFNKNSKVINVKMYEEYKKKEDAKGVVDNNPKIEKDSIDKSKYEYNERSSSSSGGDSSLDRTSKKTKTSVHSSKRQSSNDVFKSTKSYHSKDHTSSPEISSAEYENTDYKQSLKDSKRTSQNRSRSSSSESYNTSKYSNKTKMTIKKYHSSSEDNRPSRNHKHVSRKEKTKQRDSSSSDSSRSEEYSKSKRNKKRKQRDYSSSSESDSDDRNRKKHHSDRYKKKCKKNKERKKSRRRSRSASVDKKRYQSSRKQKKSKY